MRIDSWELRVLSKPVRREHPIRVDSLAALKKNTRLVLHRVERVRPNGTIEVMLIRALARAAGRARRRMEA